MSDFKKLKWEKILKNSIQCKYCSDIIEAKMVHDFVTCSCGRCSIDGGEEYLRRPAEAGSYVDLSVVENDEKRVLMRYTDLNKEIQEEAYESKVTRTLEAKNHR